jgi:recombination protein RecT
MSTAVATKKAAPSAPVKIVNLDELPLNKAIDAMTDKFAAALPAHIPADRFARAAMSACADQQILEVAQTPEGRKSIYDSCLKAATDGLLLDKRESALVKFRTKINNNWVDAAQYMPMVAGIMKKARNSGEITSIVSQVVYENDDFYIDFVADNAPVYHRPNLTDRGAMVGVYAIAKLRDGSWTQPEWMTREQVDEVRQRSQTGADTDRQGKPRTVSGPWATDYNEMARKTVIRRAAKYWPSSTDKDEPIGDWIDKREAPIEGGAVETLRLNPGRKEAGRAAALLAADAPPTDHDAETGEVIEAETVEDEAGM